MFETNMYEAALFMMCRQRLIYLGAARGKSPQEINAEAYRQMQNLLDGEEIADASAELENTKRLIMIYG